MTENEALEEHKKDCRRCIYKSCMYGVDCLQKKDIEVYEELQQYRAIGTVEEIRSMIRKSDFTQKPSKEELIAELKELSKMKMMLECFETIGTVEEFKALKDKGVAKKMSIGNDNGKTRKCCGNCRCFVLPTSSYCSKCGQKLDWQ